MTTPATTPTPAPSTVPGEKYDLPCGGWVSFVDPEDLTGRDHRRVVNNMRIKLSGAALNAGNANELAETLAADGQTMALGMDYTYGMTCMLVDAWHIPYQPRGTAYLAGHLPLPGDDPAVLESLKYRDYRKVIDLASPLIARIELAGGEVTPDDAGVPGTPTLPAGD